MQVRSAQVFSSQKEHSKFLLGSKSQDFWSHLSIVPKKSTRSSEK